MSGAWPRGFGMRDNKSLSPGDGNGPVIRMEGAGFDEYEESD